MGRSYKAKTPINAEKVKCDGPTDGRTDGPTDGLTDGRGVESRSTRLKRKEKRKYSQMRKMVSGTRALPRHPDT